MSSTERTIKFHEREFKGSRLRCLLLTSRERTTVAEFLTSLVAPHASVAATDHWAPGGFLEPDEAVLEKTPKLLELDRVVSPQELMDWWLVKSAGANTPNWDIASTCIVQGRKGLLLAEAKAHEGELNVTTDRCGSENRDNAWKINEALTKATAAWNALLPGFVLSPNKHYQLSNRFAFAWKLADMGVPVVLVYLGFLNAHEMENRARVLLTSHAQWRRCVLNRSKGIIPAAAWDRTFKVNGTPLTVLIRSAVVDIDARLGHDGVSL